MIMDLYFYMQDVRADIDRALADLDLTYFSIRVSELSTKKPCVNLDKLWDTLLYSRNITGLLNGSYFKDPRKAAMYLQAHGLSNIENPEQDSTLKLIFETFFEIPYTQDPELLDVIIRCYLVIRAIGLMTENYLTYTVDTKRFFKLQATMKTLI